MKLSLTKHLGKDDLVAWNELSSISHTQFLTDVMQLANKLPDKKFAINLCEERYSFMLAFAAVIVKQQTNLLPQSRVIENIYKVAEDYPNNYCIIETFIDGLEIEQLEIDYSLAGDTRLENQDAQELSNIATPSIDSEHTAAIAFTSGSTGKPQANSKTWGALVSGAAIAAERFGFIANPVHIVATVPPQHMYGLESSILYSLQNGCPIYAGRPFYPDDIRCAVASAQQPVILVTTPVHLRACAAALSLKWSNIKYVISATAPLRIELARQVSSNMNTKVMEIFGCTEVGAIATREPLKSEIWQLYSGLRIYKQNNKTLIHAEHIVQDIELNDRIEIVDEQHFNLIGRDSDMVNIAGKRGSLTDLTLKLQSVDGVEDAVVYLPDSDNEVNRLTAFVVTKELDEKKISTELAKKIDRVFIPRPIYRVEKLPYNATGKLTQKTLQQMHLSCKQNQKMNSK